MATVRRLRTQETLRILLERLNWPIRMVRWVAARELAGLLAMAKFRKKTTDAYLDWLSTRQLESQIVSGLAVLLCVKPEQAPKFERVCAHIFRPSILADIILQHVYGYGRRKGEWLSAHSGPVPDSFRIEKFFEDHKGAHVPPILGNYFEELERRYRFPFTRQWAFEWRQLMDAIDSPYSEYPYHFVDSMLQRSGINGQFSQTQCDVYRSAYLRTLAFAVSNWGMPAQMAGFYSSVCLPLNRELAKLKPIDRPAWLGDIPEQCCAADAPLVELARRLIALDRTQDGMRSVNLEIPINTSLFEFGDLSISAVLASDDFIPDPSDEHYSWRQTGWILPDSISFAGVLDEEDVARFTSSGIQGSCLPVCLRLWPMPSGFWHNDYFASGLALPASYAFSRRPEIACGEQAIMMSIDAESVATLSIWHDHWTPLYPKGGNTRCGMMTRMRDCDLGKAQQIHGKKPGWVVQIRLWSRKTDYGEFELAVRREFFWDT